MLRMTSPPLTNRSYWHDSMSTRRFSSGRAGIIVPLSPGLGLVALASAAPGTDRSRSAAQTSRSRIAHRLAERLVSFTSGSLLGPGPLLENDALCGLLVSSLIALLVRRLGIVLVL